MASMTDIVFLLLVFFMVTKFFVFPTALEIDLPQSSQQTPLTLYALFVDAAGSIMSLLPMPTRWLCRAIHSLCFLPK